MTEQEMENIITQNGKIKLDDIPTQSLILQRIDGPVLFTDELRDEHEDCIEDPCPVYIQGIVKSLRYSHEDDIFSCGCGSPECARIDHCFSLLRGDDIFICVNNSTVFRFDKNVAESFCFTLLKRLLIDSNKTENLRTFPGQLLSFDEITDMIKSIYPDVDFSEFKGKHVLTICPTMLGFYKDEYGVYTDFNDDGSLDFEDFNGNFVCNIFVEGLQSWAREIVPCITASECGEEYNFDFDDWNKRGLELAQKLRDQLPDKFELMYGYVSQDEKNRFELPVKLVKRK